MTNLSGKNKVGRKTVKVTICEIKEFQRIISVKMNYFPQQNTYPINGTVMENYGMNAALGCLYH